MRISGVAYFVLCGLLIESALGPPALLEDLEIENAAEIRQISQYNPEERTVRKQSVIQLHNPDKQDKHNPETRKVEKQSVIQLTAGTDKEKETKKQKKAKKGDSEEPKIKEETADEKA
eukprot:Platyproteum_vivax@DN3329_c0_g1_i1.p1